MIMRIDRSGVLVDLQLFNGTQRSGVLAISLQGPEAVDQVVIPGLHIVPFRRSVIREPPLSVFRLQFLQRFGHPVDLPDLFQGLFP